MDKSPDAFRSIGEVSRLVGVAPHVLRYWETQFSQLSPVKRGDGRRYYRPDDVRLVAGLCQVMREEGLSIRGAKRLIAADRGLGLRRIGAARLGESVPDNDPAEAVSLPRAEQLTLPADDPRPELDRVNVARAAARRRKPVGDAQSLPLFDGPQQTSRPDWLHRLTRIAQQLRKSESAGAVLPAAAIDLRDALRDAR
ncbi:MerR family transcriptional regulator [Paracoccus laeviglucosivorans]|uniref:MerR HTH family regulatory protein n=1 Tax=Paracoccus laeviglucosivorans TaxID=1197861 RepID=A0A521D4C9_9RHOB|nr:MerR family transcriptional regulator [Paracoccus laeviglucosivorans]SMO66563.1 MerR HTH family regulatory protein [Paracoccus laeviglucosivorans]